MNRRSPLTIDPGLLKKRIVGVSRKSPAFAQPYAPAMFVTPRGHQPAGNLLFRQQRHPDCFLVGGPELLVIGNSGLNLPQHVPSPTR